MVISNRSILDSLNFQLSAFDDRLVVDFGPRMSDFDENFGDDFWILLLQRFRLLLLLIQYFDEKFSPVSSLFRASLRASWQSMWRTWSKHCHFEHQDFRIEVYTSRLPFFGLFESIWRTSSVVNFSKNMNYFFSQPAYLVFISWVKRISVVNQLARQTDFERAALDKTTKMIIHYSLQRLQFHMKRGAKVVYVGIA